MKGKIYRTINRNKVPFTTNIVSIQFLLRILTRRSVNFQIRVKKKRRKIRRKFICLLWLVFLIPKQVHIDCRLQLTFRNFGFGFRYHLFSPILLSSIHEIEIFQFNSFYSGAQCSVALWFCCFYRDRIKRNYSRTHKFYETHYSS